MRQTGGNCIERVLTTLLLKTIHAKNMVLHSNVLADFGAQLLLTSIIFMS
jgi:hypothetical protein